MSDWVKIIHPDTGGIAEVHSSSLPQHYAGGWRLLAEEEERRAGPGPQPEPEPVTAAEVETALKARTSRGGRAASKTTEE